MLVVGAGNSGAEIAQEAARSGHPTWLAGRHPGEVPFRIEARKARLMVPIVMFIFRRVLTLPVTNEHSQPITERGVSPETGLYFVGLEFQYAVASDHSGPGSGRPPPPACHGHATHCSGCAGA